MKHELSTQDRQWLAALKVGFDNEAFPAETPHTRAATPSDQGGESPSPPLSVEETLALLGASVTIDYPRMLEIETRDRIMAQRRAFEAEEHVALLQRRIQDILIGIPPTAAHASTAFWRYAAIAAGLVACCTIVAFVMLVRAI